MKAMGSGLRNYMLPGTSAFRYVFNEKDYYSERIRNQKVSKASVDLGGGGLWIIDFAKKL